MAYGLKIILFATALYEINFNCIVASMLDGGAKGVDGLDGQSLISLGRKLNKPVLTIIGMALKDFHSCSEWTLWSNCNARLGYFGTKSRQRHCRQKSAMFKREVGDTSENQLGLCEGFCPAEYNVTENGFCLKFYETESTHDSGRNQCLQDGGHLINIDSDRKQEDVKTLLQGFRKGVHIDGRRTDLSSPWQFSYGSTERHLRWANGQPDDETISLCLRLDESDARLLHDCNCDFKLSYLCEISK